MKFGSSTLLSKTPDLTGFIGTQVDSRSMNHGDAGRCRFYGKLSGLLHNISAPAGTPAQPAGVGTSGWVTACAVECVTGACPAVGDTTIVKLTISWIANGVIVCVISGKGIKTMVVFNPCLSLLASSNIAVNSFCAGERIGSRSRSRSYGGATDNPARACATGIFTAGTTGGHTADRRGRWSGGNTTFV